MASDTAESTMSVVNKNTGVVRQTNSIVDLKTDADSGRSYIKGYIATKGVDKGNDEFTEEALKEMAQDIKRDVDSVKVVFPEIEEEDLKEMKESATGNIDHNNSPGNPFADTRIVPAFKIVEAEYDGHGIKVKALLNEDAMPDDISTAVKNAVEQSWLDAFSIEFIPLKVKQEERGDKTVRVIMKSVPKGAALTGRPMQERAKVTDADMKSMLRNNDAIEVTREDKNNANGDTVTEDETEDKSEVSSDSEGDEQNEAQEGKSLKEEFQELKSDVETLKEEREEKSEKIEELKEENAELKSKLEDYDEIQELKSEVSDELEGLKSELKSLTPEDEPQTDQSEERIEKSEPSRLEKTLDLVQNPKEYAEENKSALAEKYNMTEEEVIKHVK